MKMKLFNKILIVAVPALVIFSSSAPAFAASINYNDLMDDSVFDNFNTMSAGQIDSFLNKFPDSCISTNNHFVAPEPTGYSPTTSFTYGSNVSAGKVIYDAAQAYQINPEVLLATTQKEQTLVTGTAGCHPNNPNPSWPAASSPAPNKTFNCSIGGQTTKCTYACTYSGGCINIAVGYNCPYYCKTTNEGFSKQIINAAWALKFERERAEGKVTWYINKTNWDNSDDLETTYGGLMTQGTFQRQESLGATAYDGCYAISGVTTKDSECNGSSDVHVDNGATAALYDYTPFASGNTNFVNIFDSWFGSTYTPHFKADFAGQSANPAIVRGRQATVYFKYTNTGNKSWFDAVSAPQYKTYAVHLATTDPINRHDPFSATWPSSTRPAVTFKHVYEADGTTLATNQHIATPGEIAEFDFTFTVPANMKTGTYQEMFQPILEGSSWWNMGGISWFKVTVWPQEFKAGFNGQSAYPTIARGNTSAAFVKYKNIGNESWFDSTSAALYHTNAVHLATTNPINRHDPFSATWPSTMRPAINFTHVYESDGTTLAANQHIVNPGQIAEFDFTFTVPNTTTTGLHQEFFQPILEGSTPWNMGGVVWLNVTVN